MARDKARRHLAEHVARTAHHITLGTADIGDHRIAQFELRQLTEQPLQRKDRRRKLDYVSPVTSLGERVGATIHHTQFDRQFPRARVQVEADHFATKARLTQTFGERAADQPEADHHQTIYNRRRLLGVTNVVH